MKFSSLGDSALTVDFTDESSNRERLLARALSVADALEGANVPGVIDVTSAYESVAVFFDPARIERDVEEKIRALVASNAIPPALLQAGDRVRFRGITRNEFEARVKESSG